MGHGVAVARKEATEVAAGHIDLERAGLGLSGFCLLNSSRSSEQILGDPSEIHH